MYCAGFNHQDDTMLRKKRTGEFIGNVKSVTASVLEAAEVDAGTYLVLCNGGISSFDVDLQCPAERHAREPRTWAKYIQDKKSS